MTHTFAAIPARSRRRRRTSHATHPAIPLTSHFTEKVQITAGTRLINRDVPQEIVRRILGRSPESTQHYAKITPNTLAKAYNDAGYFDSNVRTIEVLVDRNAATSGAAAAGEPWQHYDLGHGFCTYTFCEQCPHRMACARCDFYIAKESSKSQLLQAKSNLQRMLVSIRSPTTNKQPSKTVKPPSTSYYNASPTFRPQPERHHDN